MEIVSNNIGRIYFFGGKILIPADVWPAANNKYGSLNAEMLHNLRE